MSDSGKIWRLKIGVSHYLQGMKGPLRAPGRQRYRLQRQEAGNQNRLLKRTPGVHLALLDPLGLHWPGFRTHCPQPSCRKPLHSAQEGTHCDWSPFSDMWGYRAGLAAGSAPRGMLETVRDSSQASPSDNSNTAASKRRAIFYLVNMPSPMKSALQMVGWHLQLLSFSLSQIHPTPEEQVTNKSVWLSTPHMSVYSCAENDPVWLWKGERQGHPFSPESSRMESSTHASSHTGLLTTPQTPQTHSHLCACSSLCLEYSSPRPSHGSHLHIPQVASAPLFPQRDFPSSWPFLNQLPPF